MNHHSLFCLIRIICNYSALPLKRDNLCTVIIILEEAFFLHTPFLLQVMSDIVFVVEMCRNCAEHGWNTRHDEAKYQDFFKRIS